MGCDGGSIPKRNEVVKNKERTPRREETEQRAAERWKQCAISDWLLIEPIVAGHMGHLMSKEAVLEHLIEWKQGRVSAYHLKSDNPDALSSINSMKDFKELKLTKNPVPGEECGTSSSLDTVRRGEFVCPITGLETNGKHKFFFSWNCGCVVSERAIKEVGEKEGKCPVCQTPYKEYDLVKINPTGRELLRNQSAFAARGMKANTKKETARGSAQSSSTNLTKSQSGESSTSAYRSRKQRERLEKGADPCSESLSRLKKRKI